MKDLEFKNLPSVSAAITHGPLSSPPLISFPENSDTSPENWGTLNALVASPPTPPPSCHLRMQSELNVRSMDLIIWALTHIFRDAYLTYGVNTAFQQTRKESFLVSQGMDKGAQFSSVMSDSLQPHGL